jgi:hypothetical protein
MTTSFVAPTGYVDLDNDCQYSIDTKSTRSREEVNPKTDLAFYFDTYIVPKYGLNNINVNNVASFMKDLEMNWTKIDPELKPKVLDIMVDSILAKDSSFKIDLLNKLGVNQIVQPTQVAEAPSNPASPINSPSVSSFKAGKSTFGATNGMSFIQISLGLIFLGLVFLLINKMAKVKQGGVARFV